MLGFTERGKSFIRVNPLETKLVISISNVQGCCCMDRRNGALQNICHRRKNRASNWEEMELDR